MKTQQSIYSAVKLHSKNNIINTMIKGLMLAVSGLKSVRETFLTLFWGQKIVISALCQRVKHFVELSSCHGAEMLNEGPAQHWSCPVGWC